MAIQYITIRDDPRLRPFMQLKDRTLAARHGLFVAEGEYLVHRLLESDWRTHSLLLTAARLERFADYAARVDILVATKEIISDIVGFSFHRGVLALGVRKPELTLDEMLQRDNVPNRLVILPEINDVENLGGLFRTAAALGWPHFLLGPSCCDAMARRAIRTSMGAVFKVAIARSSHLEQDLRRLKKEYKFQLFAAVTGDDSLQPPASQRLGLVFGSEANGLPQKLVGLCDERVTIPMATGIDSLNVVVSAGILLHHYRSD